MRYYGKGWGRTRAMKEIFRTNDPVTLSFATALLNDAGIETLVLDEHMSIIEGSLGILPRRVLVGNDHAAQARRILDDADLDLLA